MRQFLWVLIMTVPFFAVAAVPVTPQSGITAQAAQPGQGFRDYTPGMVEAALEEGKTVFIDYYASWCGTCRRQERVINALLEEKPEYAQAMELIRVNWDAFKDAEISVMHSIPRRSTLILLRGDEELGRVVAQTSKKAIAELMDKALPVN